MKSRSEKVLWIVLALVLLGTLTAKVSWRLSDLPEKRATKQGQLVHTSQARLAQDYGKLPLSFELNKGQTDSQVKFLSRSRGYTMFLTQSEAVLSLRSGQSSAPRGISPQLPRTTDYGPRMPDVLLPPLIQNPKSQIQVPPAPSAQEAAPTTVRLKLVGANLRAKVVGLDPQPGKSNYFLGNDPKKWRTNVPTYAKVKYKGVYPGIDLVYYGNQRQLEYDFVVAPGADPRVIALNIDGAEKMQIDPQGDLVLSSDGGDVRLHKPVVYQPTTDGSINLQSSIGNRQSVEGRFFLLASNRVGFDIGAYDKTQPLIIDPVLSYSTFLGGSGDDYAYGIAVDAAGNAYVTGYTSSINFPTFPGAFQPSFLGGVYYDADTFVTKLNAAGSALIYSTYLGGSGDDLAHGIAVDAAGLASVAGFTQSTDFPTTPGAVQPSWSGDCGFPYCGDAFVTKLSAAGSALVYSTYLAGSSYDYAKGIAVDVSGNAYVTGVTVSRNFPTTTGASQPSMGGGPDAFVTKLNAAGSALVYSTFLGATGYDQGLGIAVDASGSAYVAGRTGSTDFPTTPGAFQTSWGGGDWSWGDAFVTKLNAAGSALIYSTYLGGGSPWDYANGIAVDASGNAYVTGLTLSTDWGPPFPTTPGAFQTTYGGGGDAYVTKLNASGSALVYSTYLGGSYDDYGYAIAVDASGNAYVAGVADSYFDFPTTPGPLWTWPGAFITKLNAAGSALVYSTLLGGMTREQGIGLAVDATGNAFVAGYTYDSNFPTTAGAFQTSFGGGYQDAFVAKISFVPTNQPPVADAGADRVAECTGYGCAQITLDGSGSSDPDGDPLTYKWTGPFPEGGGTVTGVKPTVTLPLGTSTVTLVVNDGKVDSAPASVKITVTLQVAGLQPPLAVLVPAGTLPIFPGNAFKLGRTLPVKLQLLCQGTPQTSADVLPPRIAGLVRGGNALDLSTLDLDAGEANDNGVQFRYADGNWIYNLSTQGLSAGTYTLTIQMPDGQRYNAGFVLR